jgi:hypothetical protein
MKLLFSIVALLVVGGSFVADYKWKQWVARQKAERDADRFDDRRY